MQGPQGLSPKLLLASSSPRRRALLEESGFSCVLVPPGPELEAREGVDPSDHAREQAVAKALGAQLGAVPSPLVERGILVGGDTVVALEGRILGKPRGALEARAMLEALMGRCHEVWSALALVQVQRGKLIPGSLRQGASCARVRFKPIPETALAAYLAGEEWRDKAGAYGIQAWAGDYTELVEGSLDTVIGMPMDLFRRLLGETEGPASA